MGKEDSLIELAKLAASRHDQRRQYEWKVSFAFWALIVGAIVKKEGINIDIDTMFGWVLILLYAFLWLRGVWVANDNDKMLSEHFRKQAEAMLINSSHELGASPGKIPWNSFKFWIGFLKNWAMLFHLVVTVILVNIFFLSKSN